MTGHFLSGAFDVIHVLIVIAAIETSDLALTRRRSLGFILTTAGTVIKGQVRVIVGLKVLDPFTDASSKNCTAINGIGESLVTAWKKV